MPLQIIDTWPETSNVPAVSAVVVGQSGEIASRFAGAGRPESLYALASLTKPLVAAAVMIAIEEGALELDAPAAEHLPAYGTESRRSITARHLLSHASGLPEVGPRGVRSIDVEPVCPPATRRIYSNEGYAVLGALLAEATGIPYADYVREAVIEPLGMDAFLGLPESEHARALDVREPGLSGSGAALFNSREWRARATAAGGAFATASAYARFVQMLLAGGAPLMAQETFAEMSAVAFPGLAGGIESFQTWDLADWSLGCDVRDAKTPHWTGAATSPATLSHFGASGTLFFAEPAARLGLVCLANRSTYSGWPMRPGAWPDLCDAVLAEWSAA
jgi:CubicO group peptidase (beta-lactamase class C family)